MPDGDLTSNADVVTALVRPLTPDETSAVPGMVKQVSSRLRSRRRDVNDLIAQWALDPKPTTAVDPDVVAGVLAEIIARKLNNPKGLWSRSDTVGEGPYSETASETYPGVRAGAAAATSGGLEVTDDDLRAIFGSRSSGTRRGTIHVRVGY